MSVKRRDSEAEAISGEAADTPKGNIEMQLWKRLAESNTPPSIGDVYMAPGHLVRRCHQISLSIFADELGEHALTPVQYASLLAVRDHPGIDQRTLGHTIAVDRSTIGTVLKSLEARDLIRRTTPPENMRIKQIYVTEAGDALLSKTVAEISRVQERLLAPLSPAEQDVFMALLTRVVNVNNEFSRAPLKIA